MGKKYTAENNSKQTLCYMRHTARFKHFGLKVHWLFLMIILVHRGWDHRTFLSLETKNPLKTLAERLLPWQPWPWGGTHWTHHLVKQPRYQPQQRQQQPLSPAKDWCPKHTPMGYTRHPGFPFTVNKIGKWQLLWANFCVIHKIQKHMALEKTRGKQT